ncbi:unnamed protein product [Strongylus vulgaris]|uniref:Uncharacterized protein n=1 Tax=Strongylus vulgaris TaxID=40348 RepID=A0A3P7JNT1_STRVU|nr:unnamed protein product [Strongylus vulgaris]
MLVLNWSIRGTNTSAHLVGGFPRGRFASNPFQSSQCPSVVCPSHCMTIDALPKKRIPLGREDETLISYLNCEVLLDVESVGCTPEDVFDVATGF